MISVNALAQFPGNSVLRASNVYLRLQIQTPSHWSTLVNCAIGLVNPVLNLSEGQVVLWGGGGDLKYRRTVINAAHEKLFGAALKTLGLVHTSNNLPEWQTIKPTFFAPCEGKVISDWFWKKAVKEFTISAMKHTMYFLPKWKWQKKSSGQCYLKTWRPHARAHANRNTFVTGKNLMTHLTWFILVVCYFAICCFKNHKSFPHVTRRSVQKKV